VNVVLDAEWGAKYQTLERRVGQLLELGVGNVGGAEWTELNGELERMRSEASEHTVDLLVRGISNDRYERLVRAHPITPEQRADAKRRGENVQPWNPEEFPPALLALCLVDENGERWATEEQMAELWTSDAWNTADLADLFTAALDVCLTRPVLKFPQ
jgi:hypothetical protein